MTPVRAHTPGTRDSVTTAIMGFVGRGRSVDSRAARAVSECLTAADGSPHPVALATAVGVAAGAVGCVLGIDDNRHTWGVVDDSAQAQEIRHGGRVVGTLTLSPPAGPLPLTLATLGLPVAALRMAADVDRLRRRGDEAARKLADDRWQAVVEMEQERRRLERDLHDGAQHHLVALRMAMAVLEHGGDPAAKLADLLDRLATAERVLLDTAAGVLPATLASDGLAAALTAEFGDRAEVTLDIGGIRRRHRAEVEAAIYFVCLEAVGNAQKHAPGAPITVRIAEYDRAIVFAVSDGGRGFAVAEHRSGLHNLTTRVTAVGGTVDVRSAPGAGTTVSGRIPV